MDWDPQAVATDGYICPPCPVFHPSVEEFKHPLKYIASIRHIGMQAGICKIVPPKGWQPPFALNEKTFRFRTRVQQLNCIDGHTRAEGNFVEALRLFLYRHGTPMQELPRVDGQLLNLHLLYKTVVELGGYTTVCESNQWAQVVRRVGRTLASDRPSTALCETYREHYESCLLAYERQEDVRLRTPDVKKEVVGQTSAVSVASSTTPSDKIRSTMRKQGGGRTRTVEEAQDMESDSSPDPKRVKRTLFSVGNEKDIVKKEENADETSLQHEHSADSTTAKKEPRPEDLEPEALKPDEHRRHRLEPPEFHVGLKFYQYFPQSGAVIGQIQRVVGGKKPHVAVKYLADGSRDTIDHSTMQIVVANGWDANAAELAFKSEICQSCLRGDCWDQLLLCDGCNSGHHMFCLDVPLKQVPAGDWYCDSCVEESMAPSKETNPKFGFEMGSEYNLGMYKEKADNWKRSYFGAERDSELEHLSDLDLEREYWRILGTPQHELRLEVEYGSDVDTGSVGSGFPRTDDYLKSVKAIARRMAILSARKGATPAQKKMSELFSRGVQAMVDSGVSLNELVKKYAMDDWNLNNLPKLSGSVLQHLDEDIKGVMVPWIYMGMCFSTFCWHVEDHNFYSISYVHCGAPKTWYGVPCHKAEYFESVMKKLTPELFGSQPDLHLQLVTMFSPATLIKHGVPVYRATHNPNEFMVTFPSAYHGGFNNGFNCAEAVNFATVDWLPWGAKSVLNYKNYSKLPVFAHEALVVSLAETLVESSTFDYEAAKEHLIPAVEQLLKDADAFEMTLKENNVDQVELMAEYARRHGLSDGSSNSAIAGGTHARSCRMPKPLNSPEKSRRMAVMAPVAKPEPRTAKMSMGETMKARPTRMVIWAGTAGKSEGLRCSICKQYCYLQAVVCTRCRHQSSVGCVDHYATMCKCDAEEHYVYVHRYDQSYLPGVLTAMKARLEAVEAWEEERNTLFSQEAAPSITAAKQLLSAGRKCGGVPLEKIDDLELAIASAVKWTETATSTLKKVEHSEDTPQGDVMMLILRLMDEAERLRVAPDTHDQMKAVLGKQTECVAVTGRVLKRVEELQTKESSPSSFDLDSKHDVEMLWPQNEGRRRLLSELDGSVRNAEAMQVSLPQQMHLSVTQATEFLNILIAITDMLVRIAASSKAKTTSSQSSRPVMEYECRSLLSRLATWEMHAHTSLHKGNVLRSLLRATDFVVSELNDAMSDHSKSLEELEMLAKRSAALSIRPDRLDELENRLELCRVWETRAKQLLDPAVLMNPRVERPGIAEAERFLEDADRHYVPTTSVSRRQLHSRLQDCRRWTTAVSALFIRSSETNMSLAAFLQAAVEKFQRFHERDVHPWCRLHCICDQVLTPNASIVSCVRCARVYHTQCVSLPPSYNFHNHQNFVCLACQGPTARSYGAPAHHGRQLTQPVYPTPTYPQFCSCRGPENMSMICCDVCDEWYHSECIGMSNEEMELLDAYRCLRCAIRQNLYYLDKKNLRRDAMGRRPAFARVEALLTQLRTSLIALPEGAKELVDYVHLVQRLEAQVQQYVRAFASEFNVASFTSLSYQAEVDQLLPLMHQLTDLEVGLDTAQANLAAIHWSLRACQLVLKCERPPKFSHLVLLLNDAKQPGFTFPRQEYYHIQQTIEDHVLRATEWLRQAKMLEVEEWNVEKARRLVYLYQDLCQFLELPAADVELVFRAAGEAVVGVRPQSHWDMRQRVMYASIN
ncbi:hypothetical protein Poli38472_002627 [Pythium oligandrum]|uniref:[Histone H3]-trimethyl-L-lysine(4) demethylase n=1 Tax=Pythium oligandrum TaxID=41045 RepID=A0A8K1CJ48_PYTOL|nr:hypothetical protein Poli38472_002627 [Pythium oligandrum]|eukprot:TMW63686.1 hypothetical protein Poli38472_002627 [Pythium oligandrum]